MKGQKRVERLSPRLKETYQELQNLEAEKGAPPTVRELVKRLQLEKRHISRVHGDLVALADMGLVRILDISSRHFSARDGPHPDQVDWQALLLEE